MVGRDGGQAAPSTRHGDEVTTPRGSSGPRDPERRKGDLQGPPGPPLPQPSVGLGSPRSLLSLGVQLAGGARGQSPSSVGPGRGDTPRLGARPSPGPGSFGVQPGPPPQRSSPGAGLAIRTRSPARDPRGAPATPARARVRAGSRAWGPERAGAARAGPLGAVREGAGPGAGPHVSRPGEPMGVRRSERSPYMDMFWGRARRRPARASRFA